MFNKLRFIKCLVLILVLTSKIALAHPKGEDPISVIGKNSKLVLKQRMVFLANKKFFDVGVQVTTRGEYISGCRFFIDSSFEERFLPTGGCIVFSGAGHTKNLSTANYSVASISSPKGLEKVECYGTSSTIFGMRETLKDWATLEIAAPTEITQTQGKRHAIPDFNSIATTH